LLDSSIEILKKITSNGYQAYIVGGFVRDYILNIDSKDIDINTNATPREIKEIFENANVSNQEYGSVTVYKNSIRYEITTFRIDKKYIDHRRPIEIEYTNDLLLDLKRRDFTINTICMNENKEIIDKLNGIDDINNKIIRTVKNPNISLEEDSLRILRAIRFACTLDFELDDKLVDAIKEKKELLKDLSLNRRKEELDKIFTSSNAMKGIKLLLDLNLDKELELPNLNKVANCDNLIGVWAVIDAKYPFSNIEKDEIEKVKKVLKLDNLDPYVLYRYGLYVNQVAATIKNIKVTDLNMVYNSLSIHKRKDINITSYDIINIFNLKPDKFIERVYKNLEKEIIYCRLNNDKYDIIEYIKNNKNKFI